MKDRAVDAHLVLDPGTLRHQVVIQYVSGYAKTASGADEPTWAEFAIARACFNSERAKKFFEAGRQNVEKLYAIAMWWQPGISETMRLIFDSRAYEIMTTEDVEQRHRVLYLLVRDLT